MPLREWIIDVALGLVIALIAAPGVIWWALVIWELAQ